MARNKWIRCAFSVGMAFLISAAGIACLLTAFDLNADIGTVLLWCMLSSAVFSVAYSLRWQLLPMAILALAAGYLWQSGSLYKSFSGLLYRLTGAYNMVHGWEVLGKKGSVDMVLSAMGTVTALFVSRMVCTRRGCFLAAVFSALPLALCFPVSDTAPQPLWLGIWLFGMSLLLLTQPARRQADSKRLTGFMVLPAALLAVVLLLSIPQTAQEKPLAFAQTVTSFLEELGIGAAPGKALKADGGAVELNKLGSRKESGALVMTVTADQGGTLYLRGCAYDTYYKNNWTNLAVREQLYWPDETLLEPAGQVTIQTQYKLDMRFFPYYVTDGTLDSVSRGINNYGGAQEYSFSYSVLKERPQSQTASNGAYTQLPTVTQQWATGVLEELLTADMTDAEKITAITDYVKSCAKYSLYVEKMPEEETDFAVWFAESAGKGYCVHFATTAAVLLRAAGLPARYVTGYMVQTQAGVPAEVYGKDAHAWVECFLDGVGWVPVEATPGASASAPLAEETGEEQRAFSPQLLLYAGVALITATLAGLVIQWRVRVGIRRRKCRKGDARQRFLECYRQLSQLLGLMDESPPLELEQLAERAKFSPHQVDPETLLQTEKAIENTRKRLRKQSFLKKLHQRLILGLY